MTWHFTVVEVILLIVQILLIPIAKYFLEQYKKDIEFNFKECLRDINDDAKKNYYSNKEKINFVQNTFKHQLEIEQLKLTDLKNRLNDLEVYLEKTNGFRRRHSSPDI